jgi:UDP-N-acetylmuramoyl-tripeptide--D-alanyl-D-alanine ligase
MQLSDAAQVLQARQIGGDVIFRGVSTDTRTLAAGNLFVALQGPNFDGHEYLAEAQQKGAAAAAVNHAVTGELPQLEVENTRLALGELAAHWRRQFNLPLVAVTGSNGKTTVKEMLAGILRGCGETLVTQGNFNNEIGVPHTLFGLGKEHDYAVLELGANHPGEIRYLAGLVKPTVAVVNNAGAAHLEGFGSIEGVAKAKGELFASAGPDTTCVINSDDDYAGLWKTLAAARPVVTFGLESEADVSASWRDSDRGSELELRTPRGLATTRLALPGRHNIMNALAATAAAVALGIDPESIAAGLADARPVRGRWQAQAGINGSRIIDDTYNANPGSLQAGLAVLSAADAEAWLVLGDMGELGNESEQLHRSMGEAARRAGVRRLFTLGEQAALAADAFGDQARAFDNLNELNSELRQELRQGITLLVKGSRSMHMERVVDALRNAGPDSRGDA